MDSVRAGLKSWTRGPAGVDGSPVTIAQVNAKVSDAVDAIEAADWSTAETKLMAAKALLSVLPSRSAADGEELEFDAGAIDSLLASVQRRRAAHGGVRNTKIQFVNTPPDDE